MSFLDQFADFRPIEVLVQAKTGQGSKGPIYAAEVPDTVLATDDRKLVLAPSGEQVISETTLVADPASAPLYPPGSLVKIGGRTATVIRSGAHLIGDSELDHVTVVLT